MPTTPEHAEAWADAQAVRFRELHRIPGPVEIEEHNLDAAQRQAAEERAQHIAFMARQHGTGEADDTFEVEDDFDFSRGLLAALAITAGAISAALVIAYIGAAIWR